MNRHDTNLLIDLRAKTDPNARDKSTLKRLERKRGAADLGAPEKVLLKKATKKKVKKSA